MKLIILSLYYVDHYFALVKTKIKHTLTKRLFWLGLHLISGYFNQIFKYGSVSYKKQHQHIHNNILLTCIQAPSLWCQIYTCCYSINGSLRDVFIFLKIFFFTFLAQYCAGFQHQGRVGGGGGGWWCWLTRWRCWVRCQFRTFQTINVSSEIMILNHEYKLNDKKISYR